MRNLSLLMSCVALPATLLASTVFAQESVSAYPSKPVVMVIATDTGSPVVGEARLYGTKMQGLFGQPFVLDIKPGAGTTIGTAYVARSAPDGYTLLASAAPFTTSPAFYKDLPYDNVKDFAPVSLMSQKPFVLLVNPKFPAKNILEYIAYAKANPGKINYGTSGTGSAGHLVGAWLHSLANVKVTYIHYKGVAPQMIDLQEGRLDMVPASLPPALPLIKAGKLRALVLTSDKRSTLLPEAQTVAEQGMPGFVYISWFGFLAPGATPPAIVNKLSEGFAKVAKLPDIIAGGDIQGNVMVGSTPAQFRQLIVAETATWRKVVQENGLKLEQ